MVTIFYSYRPKPTTTTASTIVDELFKGIENKFTVSNLGIKFLEHNALRLVSSKLASLFNLESIKKLVIENQSQINLELNNILPTSSIDELVLIGNIQLKNNGDRNSGGIVSTIIPSSVRKLTIQDLYPSVINNLVPGIIPSSVQEMILDSSKHIYLLRPGIIPTSVKTLSLRFFTQVELPIGLIPPSVETLYFKNRSEILPKEGVIPISVKNLILNLGGFLTPEKFPIGMIPPSVTTLEYRDWHHFSYFFKPNEIPSSVLKLKLHCKYYEFEKFKLGSIPSSVTYLSVHDFNDLFPNNVLPPSIQKLKIKKSIEPYKKIPQSVNYLKLGRSFDSDYPIESHIINPSSVKIKDTRVVQSFEYLF
eukprot:gene6711-8316_t